MYKLLSSSRDSDDLAIGFDHSRDRRKRELLKNKTQKGKSQLRNYLKGVFGFAENQKTGTFGLSYRLTLTRITDNAVLNKNDATNNGKIEINGIECYVPHYVRSIGDYKKLLNQIYDKTPTNLHYPERSVFMKEVNTQNFWTFKLGTQDGVNVPIWVYVAFQQHDRQHDQTLKKDTFYRMPVTSAQCIIATEKYPDSATLINYEDDDYSQGYGQRKEAFKALTKDNLLQPHISEDDFRSNNNGNNDGYIIHVSDIQYQKHYQSGQPVEMNLN